MIRIALAFCLLVSGVSASHAINAKEPRGYIISYTLEGADRAGGSVARGGKDLPAKVWMALETGDVVYVRDPASRITLDLKGIGRLEVTGTRNRYPIEDASRNDGSWDIFTQIADLFSGGDAETPTNLVSKGGDLAVPMAVQGANMIVRDKRPVWIAWSGSRGPYSVTADIEGNRMAVATQDGTELSMPIPKGVKQRFLVIITDSLGKQARIVFRLRNKAPEMPAAMRKEAALHNAEAAVAAGWLAAQGTGEWRFEAARLLRDQKDETTSRLVSAIAAGWRPARPIQAPSP